MARRILTADDVAKMASGTRLQVDEHTTLTASARDMARRRSKSALSWKRTLR